MGVPLCTEGMSFLPLAIKPMLKWKDFAFSQYRRGNHNLMGYSMTTAGNYRFTVWVLWDDKAGKTSWQWGDDIPDRRKAAMSGMELYDHNADPKETTNLAYQKAYAQQVDRLFRQLQVHTDIGCQGDC